MATVRKSKKNRIIVPICLILVIAIIAGSVFVINKNKGVETVSLATISTDGITETVSATGEVTSGAVREYKTSTVATCKEVFVKVGDKVKKGDVLATFETEGIDNQISSLQATYESSANSYKQAVANQKAANAKLKVINSEIPALEKQVAKLKKEMDIETTTKKQASAEAASVNNAALMADVIIGGKDDGDTSDDTTLPTLPSLPTTPSIPTDSDTNNTLTDLVDSLSELIETINKLTDDIESTNELTRIVMTAIMDELQNGNFDSDAIAQAVGEAVAEAIEKGIVEVIDSGAAVEMIEAAVASVDWAAIGNGIGETNSVQLASAEVRLASLYAEKELFEVQADPSIANAQKQIRDNSKNTLDALKKSQQELQTGWTASINGVITECNLVAGAQTTLIETGIKLENMKTMTATISLGEYDIHKVKVGMPATIKTAYGEYTGEIATIAPTATGGAQSSVLDSVGSMAGISGLSSLTSSGAGVKCTVTIDKPDENIIAGFDASVEIVTGEYKGVPVVPIESMVREKDGTYVYLYDENEGTVTKTKIETGAISDSAYEIKSGLAIGDRIISTPAASYKEDTFKVKIADKK